MLDHTQSIRFRRHMNGQTLDIPQALPRRYRHRRYSQVVASPVPVNYAHWYIPVSAEVPQPLPGDEIWELDDTVWTVLEVNLSPLIGLWQLVCETYSLAKPTGFIDHIRLADGISDLLQAEIPVRRSTQVRAVESGRGIQRLTFYIPPHDVRPDGYDSSLILPNDVFYRREDGSSWRVVRIERPQYRTRWATVVAER